MHLDSLQSVGVFSEPDTDYEQKLPIPANTGGAAAAKQTRHMVDNPIKENWGRATHNAIFFLLLLLSDVEYASSI